MQLSEVVLVLLEAVADEFRERMPQCHECLRAWLAWMSRSKARFFALFVALFVAFFVLLSAASGPRRSRVRLQREHRPPGPPPRRACFVLDDARVERGLLVTYVQLMQAFARELDGELSVLSLGPRPGQLSAQQWLKQRRVPTSGLLWQNRPASTHTYDGGAAATASYLALEWLRQLQPQCDLLAFHGAGGTAYYSLLARAQVGLRLGFGFGFGLGLGSRQVKG